MKIPKIYISDSKITFLGDPVTWGLASKFFSIFHSRDLQTLAITAASLEICEHGNIKSAAFDLACCTALLYSSKMAEFLLADILNPTARNLCIKTKADKLPSNLDKYSNLVNAHIAFYAGVCLFGLAMETACLIHEPSISSPIITLPVLSRFARGLYRWNKVRKGDWIITDKGSQPPRHVKKPAPQRIDLTRPSWAPQLSA